MRTFFNKAWWLAPTAGLLASGSTRVWAQSFLDVYDNLGSAPTYGYSSSIATSNYGGLLSLKQGGVLGSVSFSLYNSSVSGGNIVSGTMTLSFYDGSGYAGGSIAGLPLLGNVAVPVDFSSKPLQPGTFAIFDSGNISSQSISLSPTILVTQRFQMISGTSTRYGIASGSSAAIGSPSGTYFLSNSQNDPGLYTGTSGRAVNPYYNLTVVPEPSTYAAMAGLALASWALWRNKARSQA